MKTHEFREPLSKACGLPTLRLVETLYYSDLVTSCTKGLQLTLSVNELKSIHHKAINSVRFY